MENLDIEDTSDIYVLAYLYKRELPWEYIENK